MPRRAIQNNADLARRIRQRRGELGMTIEEAAARAGVGMKTWSRYEAGEPIREDKGKGVCRALNWNGFPDQGEAAEGLSVEEFRDHKAWSAYLEERFGPLAAVSFAAGSDILGDHIEEDMEGLSSMPAGSHIGQLPMSWLEGDLPEQFLTRYDYEFLYRMKCTLGSLVMRARLGWPLIAHSVLEELIIYLCYVEAESFLELSGGIEGYKGDEASEAWVFGLFDDMGIISYLYSDMYLDSGHSYHFSHWSDQQFYMDWEAGPETSAADEKEDI